MQKMFNILNHLKCYLMHCLYFILQMCSSTLSYKYEYQKLIEKKYTFSLVSELVDFKLANMTVAIALAVAIHVHV